MKSRLSTGLRYGAVKSESCGRKFDSTRQVNQPTTRSGLRTFFGSSLRIRIPLIYFLSRFPPPPSLSISHPLPAFGPFLPPFFNAISSIHQQFFTLAPTCHIHLPSRSCLKTLKISALLQLHHLVTRPPPPPLSLFVPTWTHPLVNTDISNVSHSRHEKHAEYPKRHRPKLRSSSLRPGIANINNFKRTSRSACLPLLLSSRSLTSSELDRSIRTSTTWRTLVEPRLPRCTRTHPRQRGEPVSQRVSSYFVSR